MLRHYFLFFIAITWGSLLFAQEQSIPATKIKGGIHIDGNLDEAAWGTTSAVSHFIQSFPTFGKLPTRKTEVKILYDNQAVYVGAYLYDDRTKIRHQLTQRDNVERQDADVFTVGFDTYHDHQNAFVFQVTAAGVQADARVSQVRKDKNDDSGFDLTWDAVWESSVSIKPDGWVVELKIPLMAIRFAKKPEQTWGLQFQRFCRTENESYTWNPTNPAIGGTINQYGLWTGLKNIEPPLRLSFLPYLSGGIKSTPTGSGYLKETLTSGGLDIKYGINESFTLDLTLIPDFAQVQSDNVFLNLSPFQVKFDDYRPFFTEGTELFNKAGLFYSRRIGAAPSAVQDVLEQFGTDTSYSIRKNPGITLLYNASKFSGRTKSNLGIGVLNAVTRSMYATVVNHANGKDSTFLTEPLANYNILVLDQALKNRSSIAFTNTNVLRKGNSRNANVSAVDVSLFDSKNMYNLKLSPRISHIWGTNGSYTGFANYASFAKVSGAFQFEAGSKIESDQYDPNDLGFLDINNKVQFYTEAKYNFYNPTKHWLTHSYRLRAEHSYLYKPFRWTDLRIEGNASFVLPSFVDFFGFFEARPFWRHDYFEARTPGVVFKAMPYLFLGTGGSTDSRRKLFVSWFFGYGIAPYPNNDYYYTENEIRYRFNARLSASLRAELELDHGNRGYGFVPSNDGRPIMAARNVSRVTSIAAAQYGFSARMNLTARVRHYWSRVENRQFFKLTPEGDPEYISFIPGYNQNFNSFNIDVFYTWDFLWGSRMTLSWKNALGGIVSLDPYMYHSYRKNLEAMFSNPHSNELSLKLVYFLDYLKIAPKK